MSHGELALAALMHRGRGSIPARSQMGPGKTQATALVPLLGGVKRWVQTQTYLLIYAYISEIRLFNFSRSETSRTKRTPIKMHGHLSQDGFQFEMFSSELQ